MKPSLRTAARQARDSLTDTEVEQYSLTICNHILNHPSYQAAQLIGCYLPLNNEVDLQTMIQHAWKAGKKTYVPVVDNYTNEMNFYNYTATTILHPNRFGIAEPEISNDQPIAPKQLDLLIVPLVGFDAERNRIGQGAGFYDRYLQQCSDIATIGVAYELQKVAAIPTDEWDIALELIITEQSTY